MYHQSRRRSAFTLSLLCVVTGLFLSQNASGHGDHVTKRSTRLERCTKAGDAAVAQSLARHVTGFAIERFEISDIITDADVVTAADDLYEFWKRVLGNPTLICAQYVSTDETHFEKSYSDEAAAALVGFKLPREVGGHSAIYLPEAIVELNLAVEKALIPHIANALAVETGVPALIWKQLLKYYAEKKADVLRRVGINIPQRYDISNDEVVLGIAAKRDSRALRTRLQNFIDTNQPSFAARLANTGLRTSIPQSGTAPTPAGFTGLWVDDQTGLNVRVTVQGTQIEGRFTEPYVCRHRDGSGETSETEEAFSGSVARETATVNLTLCAWGRGNPRGTGLVQQETNLRVNSDATVLEGNWHNEADGSDVTVSFTRLDEPVSEDRVALVLGGGGGKGSWQLGVLKYLYGEMNIRPQYICGTSVGALNAMKLGEGQPESLEDLEQLWRSIDGPWDIYRPNPEFDALVNTLKGSGLAVAMSYMGAKLRRGDAEEAVIATLEGKLPESAEAINSIFLNDGLIELLRLHLRPQVIRQSGIEIRIHTVDAMDGELLIVDQFGSVQYRPWPSEEARLAWDDYTKRNPEMGSNAELDAATKRRSDRMENPPDIDLLTAMQGSSSMPMVFPPAQWFIEGPDGSIERHELYDGGARENIPIRTCLDFEADHTYVIAVSPLRIGSFPYPRTDERSPGSDRSEFLRIGVLQHALRSSEIQWNEGVWNDVAQALDAGKEIDVIAPPWPVQDTIDFGRHVIAFNIWYGYEYAKQQFSNELYDYPFLTCSSESRNLASVQDDRDIIEHRIEEITTAVRQEGVGSDNTDNMFEELERRRNQSRGLRAQADGIQDVLDENRCPRIVGLNRLDQDLPRSDPRLRPLN